MQIGDQQQPFCSSNTSTYRDISDYTSQCSCTDKEKYNIIKCREPGTNFKFSFKQYKDKRYQSGYLKETGLIIYATQRQRMVCIAWGACVLFPDSSHCRPNKLISEPYQNWKDALEDLKKHASCEYHCIFRDI